MIVCGTVISHMVHLIPEISKSFKLYLASSLWYPLYQNMVIVKIIYCWLQQLIFTAIWINFVGYSWLRHSTWWGRFEKTWSCFTKKYVLLLVTTRYTKLNGLMQIPFSCHKFIVPKFKHSFCNYPLLHKNKTVSDYIHFKLLFTKPTTSA